MSHLLPKKLPRYECLLEASQRFPDLDPSAMEAYLHMLRAGSECLEFGNEFLSKHGVSSGRFTVLMLLFMRNTCGAEAEITTPAELADMAGCTRATMTGLIDTLERDDLVKRAPDEEDRRMMTVNLTPKGSALLTGMLPGHFKRLAKLMSCLNETERKTLVRLMIKILAQVAVMRGEDLAAGAGGCQA